MVGQWEVKFFFLTSRVFNGKEQSQTELVEFIFILKRLSLCYIYKSDNFSGATNSYPTSQWKIPIYHTQPPLPGKISLSSERKHHRLTSGVVSDFQFFSFLDSNLNSENRLQKCNPWMIISHQFSFCRFDCTPFVSSTNKSGLNPPRMV